MTTLRITCLCSILLVSADLHGDLKQRIIENPFVWQKGELPGRALTLEQEISEGDLIVAGQKNRDIRVELDDFSGIESEHFLLLDENTGILRLFRDPSEDEDSVHWELPDDSGLRLNIRDGDAWISDILGEIEISMIDGDLTLESVGGSIVAELTDGDAQISVAPGQAVKGIFLSSVDGDIRLSLPTSVNATIRASTVDGDIICDYPVNSQSLKALAGRNSGPKQFEAEVGSGDASIHIRTVDGDIVITESSATSRTP